MCSVYSIFQMEALWSSSNVNPDQRVLILLFLHLLISVQESQPPTVNTARTNWREIIPTPTPDKPFFNLKYRVCPSWKIIVLTRGSSCRIGELGDKHSNWDENWHRSLQMPVFNSAGGPMKCWKEIDSPWWFLVGLKKHICLMLMGPDDNRGQ